MNTFLPYPDFAESARVLDWRRLGKQRLEVLQILRSLDGTSKGWANHPATRMWDGYVYQLTLYGEAICTEWLARGYVDSLRGAIRMYRKPGLPRESPPWLGMPAFHAAHRSNLLRKDPVYYGQFGWKEPIDLPYIWGVDTNGR